MTLDDRAVSASSDHTLKVCDAAAITPDSRTIIAGDSLGRMHFLRVHGLC